MAPSQGSVAGTLITVAPTGAELAKADFPQLPTTLDELVETAVACEAAGAAMIHLHIRDGEHRPTLDHGHLKAAVDALREQTSLVIQLSTGGSVHDPLDQRLTVLDAEPDSCSLTCGTTNFGDDVFLNPYGFMSDLYVQAQEREVVPEFELFDLGPRGVAGAGSSTRTACRSAARCTSTSSPVCREVCRVRPLRCSPAWRCCRPRSPRGRRPASVAATCRWLPPRSPRAATCGSGWRTTSSTRGACRSSTTPSSSSGRPTWPRSCSARPVHRGRPHHARGQGPRLDPIGTIFTPGRRHRPDRVRNLRCGVLSAAPFVCRVIGNTLPPVCILLTRASTMGA